MARLVSFRIGERTVLVTTKDALDLDEDMHLYGFLCVSQTHDGFYERIAPNNVKLTKDGATVPKRRLK